VTLYLGAAPTGRTDPRFRFSWPGKRAAEPDDGVIDPRDTRTVLGLCLAMVSVGFHQRSPWPRATDVPTSRPGHGVFQIRGWQ